MSKKTPEQAAEEYAFKEYSPVPIRDCETSFLAGRKHFIEHELKGYLEMARATYCCKSVLFIYDEIDEIIKKALED